MVRISGSPAFSKPKWIGYFIRFQSLINVPVVTLVTLKSIKS